MTQRNDGGPAFAGAILPPHPELSQGLTKRDWFAGQAWAAEAARYDAGEVKEYEWSRYLPGNGPVRREEIIAVLAFLAADAMLARREEPPA